MVDRLDRGSVGIKEILRAGEDEVGRTTSL